MNIWEKMASCEPELTPKEQEVYELLKQHTYLFSTSTASNLAMRFGIAQSAISRFCQKVGYTGFSDFRLDLVMARTGHQPADGSGEAPDFMRSFIQLTREVGQAVSLSQLNALCSRILSCSGVYLSGTSNSNISAHNLNVRLTIFGIRSCLISTGFEIETMRIIRPTDIVILFSAENPTYRDFLTFVAELPASKRPYIVMVANTAYHPLRKMVDEVVALPSYTPSRFPVYLDSSVAPMIFCYMLAAQLEQMIAQMKDGQ